MQITRRYQHENRKSEKEIEDAAVQKDERKTGYRPTSHLVMRLRCLWGELTSARTREEEAQVGAYTKNAYGGRVPIREGGHRQE